MQLAFEFLCFGHPSVPRSKRSRNQEICRWIFLEARCSNPPQRRRDWRQDGTVHVVQNCAPGESPKAERFETQCSTPPGMIRSANYSTGIRRSDELAGVEGVGAMCVVLRIGELHCPLGLPAAFSNVSIANIRPGSLGRCSVHFCLLWWSCENKNAIRR